YRRAGSNPFAFSGALRRDWSTGASLEALRWDVEASDSLPRSGRETGVAPRIVEALSRGKRVAIESPGPIDGLAREVWLALPGSKDPRVTTRETPGSTDPEPPVGPEERARIVEGLEAMADRFEAFEIGRWGDPSELMARISDRLRYRGATLSATDRARLASDPD